MVARGSEPVPACAESPAEPVLAELEDVLAMLRTGADPKALRRVLRRIEELLLQDRLCFSSRLGEADEVAASRHYSLVMTHCTASHSVRMPGTNSKGMIVHAR